MNGFSEFILERFCVLGEIGDNCLGIVFKLSQSHRSLKIKCSDTIILDLKIMREC